MNKTEKNVDLSAPPDLELYFDKQIMDTVAAVVAGAVDPVGNLEQSGKLSTSPQPEVQLLWGMVSPASFSLPLSR